MMPDKLYFVEPTFYHNNFGIQMHGSPELIARLDVLCRREFDARWRDDPRAEEKRAFGAFWQGVATDWLYIEFWMAKTPDNRAKITAVGRRIASELGVEFVS